MQVRGVEESETSRPGRHGIGAETAEPFQCRQIAGRDVGIAILASSRRFPIADKYLETGLLLVIKNPCVRCRRHATTRTRGSAVISFGVIASRVRRQERKNGVMRAGTVAWSRIIGVCFQFNDFVVVKRGRNEFRKLTHLLVEKHRDYAHNRGNLIPEVASASILTCRAILETVPFGNRYTRCENDLFALPVWRALVQESVHSLAKILAHVGL